MNKEKITRLEVIDDEGRQFVRYFEAGEMKFDLQDEGRTLKIFLSVNK